MSLPLPSMKIRLLLLLAFIIQYPCYAQTKTEKIDELLRTYHALGQFNGNALVLEKGKVILHSGYGYQNVEDKTLNYSKSIFQIGSITKQFTAAIILKLAEQGKLKLTDKLSNYYPAFTKADSITIHQILSHTSGIPNYTDDQSFMQNEVTMPVTEERMLALFSKKPLDFSPGSQFNYSNSGYYLLGAIIRKVTGKPYEQVVREMIFKPLGMNSSGFDFAHLINADKATGYGSFGDEEIHKERMVDSTVSFSGGSIYSTTGDLLKWNYGLLNNKIISRKSLDKAFAIYKNNFGYGWVIDSASGQKAVYHNGSIPGFTSNIYRIEKDNVCIILLNNTANSQIDEITKGIVNILYNKTYKLPVLRFAIDLPAAEAKKYLGTFELSPDFKLKVFEENGKLYAQRLGEDQWFRIYYYKENHFFLKKMDAQLEFRLLEKVVILHQGGRELKGKRID
jgi:CubicO group peptidase (beta-lactamase class C family)